MLRLSLIAVPLFFLAGCTSLCNPSIRADLYETQARGAAALDGNEAAFDRLEQLQQDWASRGEQDWRYKLMPWDRANRERAAVLAAGVGRITQARDAVIAQRELVDVMSNALRDLEEEYDTILDTMMQDEAPAATLRVITDQKFLAQRMAGSLVLMSTSDMSHAVEAADLFGRDVNRFQRLLGIATGGDEELGVEPPDNPEIEDSLAQIDELFNGYVSDSAPDVLDNVVARYDAWLALGDMAALTPMKSEPGKSDEPGGEAETAAAAEAASASEPEMPADEVPEDAMPAEDGDMPIDTPPEDASPDDTPPSVVI